MTIAKVITIGRSQAIRLPRQFRVDADKVYLKRTREGFLVIARDPWKIFFDGIHELSADFMSAGRDWPKLEGGIEPEGLWKGL